MKHKSIRIILILLIISLLIGVSINSSIGIKINKKTKENKNEINSDSLRVHYIDVGQGDSILIQTPDSYNMLIDTGSSHFSDDVINFLYDQSAYTIDVFIATHPHEDHIGGVPEIFNSFEIKNVYHPGYQQDSQTYQNFLTAIENEGCSIYTDDELDPGDYIDFSYSATCQILNIDKDAPNTNAASIVLKLTYDYISFLFTGDIDVEVEQDLVDLWDVNVDILKVAHHGSKHGSSDYFLSEATPEDSIICVGEDNRYGHPHDEALQRLESYHSTIYRTDINGDITVETRGEDYTIYYEKSEDKPLTPIIEGPTYEEPYNEYTYSAYSTDPEGDILYYTWDWDDGEEDLMVGPFYSGETCYNSHEWDSEGTYYIKVKATDEYGYESEWGILKVNMPRKKQIIFKGYLDYILENFFPDIF